MAKVNKEVRVEAYGDVLEGEVEQLNLPAVIKTQPIRVSKYAADVKNLKQINVPMFKLNHGDLVALEFTGETFLRQLDKKTKEPAKLYRAVDMDTGEIVDFIGPTIFNNVVEAEYGGDVAGRRLLLRGEKREGKAYLSVYVSEILS